jgi:hypothetical protein
MASSIFGGVFFVVLGDTTKNTIKVSGFHHTKADHVG